MKKTLIIVACVALIVVLAILFDPTNVLIGRLKGETFYGGRPVSYWRQALRDEDPAAREQSRRRLAEGGTGAVPLLVGLLDDVSSASGGDDAETRWTAAEILGEIGPEAADATAALIQALDDPDPHVRLVAAASLPSVGAPAVEAVPALVKLLKQQPTVVVARSLSEYGLDAKPAVADLIVIMNNGDLATDIRWNAARTLGKIRVNAVEAVPELIAALDDPEATIREHCAEALGDIGPLAAEGVPDLIGVLDDPATRVRRDAVRSLGQIGEAAKPAIPEIIKLLKDPEQIVRDAAETSLRALAPDKLPQANQSDVDNSHDG